MLGASGVVLPFMGAFFALLIGLAYHHTLPSAREQYEEAMADQERFER